MRCFQQPPFGEHVFLLVQAGKFGCPVFACLVIALQFFLVAEAAQAVDEGQQIYSLKCASCHGSAGEGNEDHFADPLRGDLSLAELGKLITETMPENDPGKCVAEEAQSVAEYVFENFYSAAAQRRLKEARVELSRLTVRQYRESVADLIGSFKDSVRVPDARGIHGVYFAARHWTDKKRLSDQTDETIDFGEGVPHFDPTGEYRSIEKDNDPNKDVNLMNQGFSVYWAGGIIVPETGLYEITVESKNGFDLYINDMDHPLIDRKVRSDDVVEHQASIYLLGGRSFGLKLYLFSYPQPPARIRLLWRKPGGPLEVIPATALISETPPEVAVVSTTFPADDSSSGYQRGVSVSEQWDAAITEAAVETANWVSDRIWKLAGTKEASDDAVPRVREFCSQFVARAFGKQLTDEEQYFFIGQHFDQELSVKDQVKRVLILALKSPRFLYPAVERRSKDRQMARRMALHLWDSLPDHSLLKLADKGELSTPEAINHELERMVEDPRSKEKLQSFFHAWLKSEHATEATKDQRLFPEFDQRLVSDLKTSLELFLDDVIWTGNSDFRELFLADYLYVNDRMAKFYGIQYGGTGFQQVKVDPDTRAGILTHPFLMTGLAYYKDSSPIHRGVFVAKQFLGRRLRQPPSNVKPLTEEFNPTLTTRERVEYQTKESGCMNCHSVINPLGFCLEHYDAVGRFRTEEKAKLIDVSSIYETPDGSQVELHGARELASFLADNELVQRNFIQQLFNYYAKQSVHAYGTGQLDQLQQRFVQSGFSIRQLLIDITRVTVEFETADPE